MLEGKEELMRPLKRELDLEAVLKKLAPVAIAFSGGADSAMLAAFAAKVLPKDQILLVHADSVFSPGNERVDAEIFALSRSLKIKIMHLDPLSCVDVASNPKDRCYHCKKIIMGEALKAAASEGFPTLCDGTNTDDLSDYRPGMKACDELGIKHPLLEAGLGKKDIRLISRRLGIDSWMKPSSACMASRIPTGTALSEDVLSAARRAENALAEMGFRGTRVRCIDGLNKARLEFKPIYLHRAFAMKNEIESALKSAGFASVEIDPSGYRRGSMNT